MSPGKRLQSRERGIHIAARRPVSDPFSRPASLFGRIYDGLSSFGLRGVRESAADLVRIQGGEKLLDVCCGTGLQFDYFGKGSPGRRLGIDFNQRLLLYARKRRPDSFVRADAVLLPFRDSLFDVALISYALHDKFEEQRRSIVRETLRILRPNGVLVLVDFDPPWNRKSHWGGRLVTAVERLAGREHFKNGRRFLENGGLTGLIREMKLLEIERRLHAPSQTVVAAVRSR